MSTAGYESEILRAFVLEHGRTREDGLVVEVNESRTAYSERLKLARWWTLDVVPMEAVDRFLMTHDLMLFELEHWARERYGRDGYLDPNAEPAELVM